MDIINISLRRCSLKNIIKKMKRQTTEKKKILTIHISNKRGLGRIYEQFSLLNNFLNQF